MLYANNAYKSTQNLKRIDFILFLIQYFELQVNAFHIFEI